MISLWIVVFVITLAVTIVGMRQSMQHTEIDVSASAVFEPRHTAMPALAASLQPSAPARRQSDIDVNASAFFEPKQSAVPGLNMDDASLAASLQALAPDSLDFDIAAYVANLHELYFDVHRHVNQHHDNYVHFHNWDHARNVWSFAHWFAQEASLENEAAFFLTLAALSHDVMHPGTKNSAMDVESTFRPILERMTNSSQTLEHYALDVVNLAGLNSDAERMWETLGCTLDQGYNACYDATGAFAVGTDKNAEVETLCNDIPDLFPSKDDVKEPGKLSCMLIARAPQETLHAWITGTLLQKFGPNSFDKARMRHVLVPIIHTSISAHFAIGLPQYSKHVEREVEHADLSHQLGLVLHLLDMGYLLQSQEPEAGMYFAANYLVESGNYPKGLSSWQTIMGDQKFFTEKVVKAYLDDLGKMKGIPGNVFRNLQLAGVHFFAHLKEADGEAQLQDQLQRELAVGKSMNTLAYQEVMKHPLCKEIHIH